MKKKVVCFLILALFILISCTILSTKIEEEMLTQVTVREVKPKSSGTAVVVSAPLTYLYFDNESIDTIDEDIDAIMQEENYYTYQLEDGTGWLDGLRVREIEKEAYHLDLLERALVGFDETKAWKFISGASRRPQVGQKVEILKNEEKGTEYYLLRYPEGIPEVEIPPKNLKILTQSGNSMLVSLDQAPQALLKIRTRLQLGEYGPLSCEIYSIRAVDQFLACLPKIVQVAGILLFALVVWVQSYCLLKNDWENRWFLRINFILGLVLIWYLWTVLQQIDLPASLLPDSNIFDRACYAREFSVIFDSLKDLRSDLFVTLRTLGQNGQNTLNLACRTAKQVRQTAAVWLLLPPLWLSIHAVIRHFYPIENED